MRFRTRLSLTAALIGFSALGSTLALSGCGGGSNTARLTSESGSRAQIARVVQEIATRSGEMEPVYAGKTDPSGGLRASNRDAGVSRSRETRPQDGDDATIGSIRDFGDGLWARLDRVEYQEIGGLRRVAGRFESLFLDQDATQPAGSSYFSLTLAAGGFALDKNFEITAGPRAGSSSRYSTSQDAETGVFQYVSEGSALLPAPDGTLSPYIYSNTFETRDGVTTFRDRYVNGAVEFASNGVYRPDGSGEANWTTTSGYTVAWVSNADGTGSFTVANPNDPLTPASGTFEAGGNGTITFADGTTSPFNLYELNFYR